VLRQDEPFELLIDRVVEFPHLSPSFCAASAAVLAVEAGQ
jgi:hypothetical protein